MRKKTLLLISGSQVLMDITKKILERENYSVRCTGGIAGTRELLLDVTPDCVILEKELADGNGLDYCRELREISDVPIMFVSGRNEDKIAALKAGANEFLKKPYDYEVFKSRIDAMLSGEASSYRADESVKRERENEAALPVYQREEQTRKSIKPKRIAKFVSFLTSPERKEGHRPTLKRFYMFAAACASFFLVGLGIYKTLGDGETYIDFNGMNVPLGEWRPETTEEPGGKPEHDTHFPKTISIEAYAGKTDAKTLLLNPEDNIYLFTLEITIAGTGELLYKSEMLNPGTRLEHITLLRALESGESEIEATICAYLKDDPVPMVCASVDAQIRFQ